MNRLDQKCNSESDLLKVLVIDPFLMYRDVLRKKIRDRCPDAHITEIDKTERLSKIIQRESPGIVFVDFAMYPKHALAHVRSIKRQLPASVIVVLTTHDSAEHEAAAYQYGADYFISKAKPSSLPLIDKVLDTVS